MLQSEYIQTYGLEQFKKRYWKSKSITVNFKISSMPEYFSAGDLDSWFGGSLSYFSSGFPTGSEVTKAKVIFPRPIKKADDISCSLKLGYEAGPNFSVNIPWAHGVDDKNISSDVSSKYYSKIASILEAGKGAGVEGCVVQTGGSDHSGTIIRFASSRPYAQDAQGHGNWTTFTLEATIRYDPARDYQQSTAALNNYSAIACDTSRPQSITDENCIFARISSTKYDEHVYHKVNWYTTDESRQNHLMYINPQTNQLVLSDTPSTVFYVDGTSELQLRFPVPQEWCNAWPNQTVGWGYFTMETWYRYTKHSQDAEAPEFQLGVLEKPLSYVVQTPDYIIPTIDFTELNVIPSKLPFGNGTLENELSAEWVQEGCYIQKYCTINLEVRGSGVFGSTIESYVFLEDTYRAIRRQLLNGRTETSIQNVPMSGNLAFTVYAKDSRGRYSEVKYVNIPNAYNKVKMDMKDENGEIIYLNGVKQTYDAIPIQSYSSPLFDYTRSYRVNDLGDLSENGKYISAEAGAIKSSVLRPADSADLNQVYMYFQFTEQGENANWRPAFSSKTQLTQGYPKIYTDELIFPALDYSLKFVLDDSMTQYLNQEAAAYNAYQQEQLQQGLIRPDQVEDIQSFSIQTIEVLGSGDCTVFLKRDGLGIGIGMTPKTDLNYRCLEIAENWELRHGEDEQTGVVYLIPDVVFTPYGDPLPPKRKKGRLWLHEIG